MIAMISGCGSNVASIQCALERLGKKSHLTQDVHEIQSASHVILPGVGTAGSAMQRLDQLKLLDVIRTLKQPVLGICLGMQILHAFSEESDGLECLNIFPGKIVDFAHIPHLVIPHMGWNQIQVSANPLFENIQSGSYVYFVHRFKAALTAQTIASSFYGETFAAAVQSDNFYGVQFHPERSGKIGEIILQNFLNLG